MPEQENNDAEPEHNPSASSAAVPGEEAVLSHERVWTYIPLTQQPDYWVSPEVFISWLILSTWTAIRLR